MNIWILLVAVVAAVAFASIPMADREDPASHIDGVFTELMNQQYQSQPTSWLRQAHAKQHGCVRVEVHVNASLTPPLAAGMFQPGAVYPAFVRYSNGAGRGFTPPPVRANESDALPDTRGLALKVFNVTGDYLMPSNGSQAFTMTTCPTSFLATPEQAIGFFDAVHKGALAVTGFLALNPSVAKGIAATTLYGAIGNLLTATFYTAPVQMHGDIPAKYQISPCDLTRESLERHDDAAREKASRLDPNFLTDNLIRDVWTNLAEDEEICLQWGVQLFEDDDTTPINDTTIAWEVPVHPLARILIPRQFVWDDGKLEFCRHMSFNPWLTIAAHQPVGFLQEIRRAVYTSMAAQRRQLQGESPADASYADYVNYPNL